MLLVYIWGWRMHQERQQSDSRPSHLVRQTLRVTINGRIWFAWSGRTILRGVARSHLIWPGHCMRTHERPIRPPFCLPITWSGRPLGADQIRPMSRLSMMSGIRKPTINRHRHECTAASIATCQRETWRVRGHQLLRHCACHRRCWENCFWDSSNFFHIFVLKA